VKEEASSSAIGSLAKACNPLKEQVREVLSLAGIELDGRRDWDISVKNDAFYGRVLRYGSLGLGESYMDGWWDCRALDEFITRLLRAELDRKRFWNAPLLLDYLAVLLFNRQTKSRAKGSVEHHYGLGNDLYQAMLDGRMVYTAGRWEHASTLDEAQEAKLDFVCCKLGLQSGMTLLDIGCGWGSLAKFSAEGYGASVVGITLSSEQMELAQRLCAGLPIEIRLQDYRDLSGTFDRVASLGMFEHVGTKNYRRFFDIARRSLRPGGLFLLSTIGVNCSDRGTDPWLGKYIFPNSHLPSAAQIGTAIEGLFIIEDWQNWAADYDRTVVAWFQNFHAHWRDLQARYGERFYRMWKYYLMASAGCFRSRKCQDWQILLARD